MQHSIDDFISKIRVLQVKADSLDREFNTGISKDDPSIQYLIDDIQALALEIAKDRA